MRTAIRIAALTAIVLTATGIAVANGKQEAPPPMMEASAAMMDEGTGNGNPVPPPGPTGEYQKPSQAKLRSTLTDMQYMVTQQDGTEPPFQNEYWSNHEAGIYVDIVSGEPLFSSTDKFESGTGWPSFTRPLESGNVVEMRDTSFGMLRTELRSYYADSHLGHIFNDGPAPTGLRYCIDSAALHFVPVANLETEGYGAYASLFDGGQK